MLTPEEAKALAIVLVLVTFGACLRLVESRHPRFLTLTLGDSLALGTPGPPVPAAPEPSPASEIPEKARPGTASDVLSDRAKKPAFGVDGRLDLNRASADDLVGLPGIGPKTAARIVEDRKVRGRFRSPSELERVKGIGPKTLERLLPFLVVRAAADSQ